MLKLNRRDRNLVHETIVRKGLDPARFRWEHVESRHVKVYEEHYYDVLAGDRPDQAEVLVVTHGDRDCYFTFERDVQGVYWSSLEPYIDVGNDVRAQTWAGLLGAFEEWLDTVRYEIEEPDLWSSLRRTSLLAVTPGNLQNDEAFSKEEAEAIRERLAEVESFIRNTNQLSNAQVIQLQQTFLYLGDKAETVSKIDWKNIFAGAIVSAVVALGLENAPAILDLCNRLFSPFFEKLLQ